MENAHSEKLRTELCQLLQKQSEILESRQFGTASDTELLEYELRQEVVHHLCNQLSRCISS